ncbi:sulfur carrier protein ThiS [Pseudomonas sp. P66]|uniref:Sulfur carrier protein ThiS n=1 Tax=Pseudomonas arcuscaelestis TaxID=2710591 RepID=A0ABS2BX10_9PSED|nr:sulfur carrier protein ThiS [Pseudomonas arcuscaelestis]MBM3108879.1 sulfur carrier protein ThiS [Pseudomonas arcuscaelestis]MBM3113979.1 sulfur carrier protein ThiS [Pseudomonas arcuscaelestis]MBM5458154.1 sulfur carrier protein ThiS [Pseudomonas arcuscaelestis]
MEVEINGVAQWLPADINLAQLLVRLQLQERRLAIEYNLDVVPRSEYAELRLKQGDRVEIVHAIGGG